MRKIGEGVVNKAFLDEYENRITLIPKQPAHFKKLRELKGFLDLLDGRIKTLQIPCDAKLVEPCSEYPNGALSYQYVPGRVATDRVSQMTAAQKIAIGKKLVEFICEMQSLDLKFDKQAEIESNIKRLNQAIPIIKPHLTKSEFAIVQKIAEEYPNFLESRKFYVTHGDLHLGNLIVDDDNNLVGVIDFANFDFYVPEMEFVSMMHQHGILDKEVFDSAFKSYPGKISMKDVRYLQLVHRMRYFKHSVFWDEQMKAGEIEKFRLLLAEYFSAK